MLSARSALCRKSEQEEIPFSFGDGAIERDFRSIPTRKSPMINLALAGQPGRMFQQLIHFFCRARSASAAIFWHFLGFSLAFFD
jgi:hypothetical protein